jgi:hypothetical protein
MGLWKICSWIVLTQDFFLEFSSRVMQIFVLHEYNVIR